MKIRQKLFLAMMAVTGLTVAGMTFAQQMSFQKGFEDYTRELASERLQAASETLAAAYAQTESWAFLNERVEKTNQRDLALPSSPFRKFISLQNLNLLDSVTLLDANGQWIAGTQTFDEGIKQDIILESEVIGFIVFTPPERWYSELDDQFAKKQRQYNLLVATLALLATLVSAGLLARSFAAPIKQLSDGANKLASGHFNTRLDLDRNDEFGALGKDFNALADKLQRGQDERRAWVADTSHELRTPIAVLQAELEAIEDGVRPLTVEGLGSFSSELKRLRLLVGDLHQLSQSDSGVLIRQREPFNLSGMLRETAGSFQQKLEREVIEVSLYITNQVIVEGDRDRLEQVFINIFENTLRYTDHGGAVHIKCKPAIKSVCISIEDTAPGVPDEALNSLFNRFYRVDGSRSRETGASGLGLAICAAIVEAHDGTIKARHSELGGLCIDIFLPTEQA